MTNIYPLKKKEKHRKYVAHHFRGVINFGKCYCNVRNSTLGTIQSEKDSIDWYWVHGGGQ